MKEMNEEIINKFHEPMNKLGKMHEHSKVFVDFMDYYIYTNSNSPDRPVPHGYKEEELELFHEAYNGFKELMKELLEKYGWYDYIGEYYEEYVLSGTKASMKGQFYTPRQISSLLSKIVGYDAPLDSAYDPACGSARNLCEYHYRHPGVRCTGEDLDESACKMAVINFHLHGVNGVVNWIDALTREYMGVSWKVLGDRIYITDLDWIRTVDEVYDTVNILLLSDETLAELCELLLKNGGINEGTDKEINDAPIDDTNTKHSNGGLDDWF